jgi:DNA-binding response OmpR family regulator
MGAKKILVVDDDRDLLHGLTIRLKSEGYNVVAASDAVSATSTARKENPDVVILDLGLPGGDGYVVMDRLRSMLTMDAPIIVLTARDPLTDSGKSIGKGAFAFFQKPADHHMLLATIRKALGEPEPALKSGR